MDRNKSRPWKCSTVLFTSQYVAILCQCWMWNFISICISILDFEVHKVCFKWGTTVLLIWSQFALHSNAETLIEIRNGTVEHPPAQRQSPTWIRHAGRPLRKREWGRKLFSSSFASCKEKEMDWEDRQPRRTGRWSRGWAGGGKKPMAPDRTELPGWLVGIRGAIIPALDPSRESDFQLLGNSSSLFGSSKKWNQYTYRRGAMIQGSGSRVRFSVIWQIQIRIGIQ